MNGYQQLDSRKSTDKSEISSHTHIYKIARRSAGSRSSSGSSSSSQQRQKLLYCSLGLAVTVHALHIRLLELEEH